jgi:hypothetical protein
MGLVLAENVVPVHVVFVGGLPAFLTQWPAKLARTGCAAARGSHSGPGRRRTAMRLSRSTRPKLQCLQLGGGLTNSLDCFSFDCGR